MISTTLTEPKTAFAGVILESSFARFMASIDTFNVMTRAPRPFRLLEFVAIVEDGSKCRKRRGTEGVGQKPDPVTRMSGDIIMTCLV